MKELDSKENLNENDERIVTEAEYNELEKKKKEQDIYGYHYIKEQEQKHFEEGLGNVPPKKDEYLKSSLEDDDLFEGEEVEAEESVYTRYGKNSIGLTITPETNVSDAHLRDVYGNQSSSSKTIINGYSVEVGFNELHNDMVDTLGRLHRTSMGSDGKEKALPDDFNEIAKAMEEYSHLYQNRETNGITLEELGRKYDNVMNMTRKYLVEHKPRVKGHRSLESSENYMTLKAFYEKGKIGVNTVNTMVKDINKAMREDAKNNGNPEDSISIKDIKMSELGDTIREINSPGSQNFRQDYINIAKVRFGNQRNHEEVNIFKKRIMNNLKNASMNDSALDVEEYLKTGRLYNSKNVNPHAYAMGYASKHYLDKLKDRNVSLDELKLMYRQTSSKQFTRYVDNLSKNPAFQGAVFADPDHFGKWDMVQRRTNEILAGNREDLRRNFNRSAADYARQGINYITPEVAVDFMMGLAMNSPKNRAFVESIAAQEVFDCPFGGNRTYAALQERMSKVLSDKNGLLKDYLGRPLSEIPRMVEFLNSDKVMNPVSKVANKEAYQGMKASAKYMKENNTLRQQGKSPTAENVRIAKFRKELLAKERAQKKAEAKKAAEAGKKANRGAGRR